MLNKNDFILFLTSGFAGTSNSCPRQSSQGYHSPHASEFATSNSSQGFYNRPASASGSQYDPQPHGIKGNQPRHTPTDFSRVILPPSKTVMVITHLRFGKMSTTGKDVQYLVPGFVVPDYVTNDLSHKWSKHSDAELVIFLDERDEVACKVFKKIGKAMQQSIKLNLDETVMLQTRIRDGHISYAGEDLLFRHSNWELLPHVSEALRQKFKSTSNAEIIFISDSQGNLRYVVNDGTFREMCKFENF